MAETAATPQQAEDQVTLGDKRVELSAFDRYKGRAGYTDRVAFPTNTLLRAWVHTHQNRLFRCLSTEPPKKPSYCCEELKTTPEQRFGLVVFHYTTSEDGELFDLEKLQGKIKLWPITESRYQGLSTVHKKWPILDAGFTNPQYDLTMKCTDDKWQRMEINPCPEAHWRQKQEWYEAIKGRVPKATEQLKKAIGRVLTEQEVRTLFGQASAPDKPPSAGDIDLSDVLDQP